MNATMTRRRLLAAAAPASLAGVAAAPADALAEAAAAYDAARTDLAEAHDDPRDEDGFWTAMETFNRAEAALKAALRAAGRAWVEHDGRCYSLFNPRSLPHVLDWDPAAGVEPDEDLDVQIVVA